MGPFFFLFQRGLAVASALRRLAAGPRLVSERPASLFERPSMTVGRRKKSSKIQWVAAFTGSSCSRDNPVTETDTKAQGGRKDGSVAADHQVSAAGALLRDRMRDLVRNNPHAAKAVAVLVNNIIGSGLNRRTMPSLKASTASSARSV